MPDTIQHVLFVCTGNSARSILAEALINREGRGRFKAFSAGSQPKGVPNPAGLGLLAELGYDTSHFRSKSWTEFNGPDAPQMDFIITVCDSAAGESCPVWPGHPLRAHWGIPDPADVGDTDAERRVAFLEAYRRLSARVTAFVNLPVEALDLDSMKQELERTGRYRVRLTRESDAYVALYRRVSIARQADAAAVLHARSGLLIMDQAALDGHRFGRPGPDTHRTSARGGAG
mgnify:CR=1 FL=1